MAAHYAHHLHRVTSAPTMPGRSVSPRRVRHDFRDNCGAVVDELDKGGRVTARYRCGALLGRGGFAKCFEFTDLETNTIFAAKVIDRSSLTKPKTLQKLHSEIAIHRRMKHLNIVDFVKTFQDDYYVYILLELCRNQTLMEVSKTRRYFSVPETQYLMIQMLSAVQYMHTNNVIHRDLKLGNCMMDDDMNVKVGDFGLAAELQFDGERKRTICGTPNYIAPEILEGAHNGHSYEADIWSLGVILYTLLVGKPPFETSDVKTTYNRIKLCKYSFPPGCTVSEAGKDLVHRILKSEPTRRPSLIEIRQHPFFADAPTVAPNSLFPDGQRRQREARGCAPLCAVPLNREPLRNLRPPAVNLQAQDLKPAVELPRRSASPRDTNPPVSGVANLLSARGPASNALYNPNGVTESLRTRTSSVPALTRPLAGTAWAPPSATEAALHPSSFNPPPASTRVSPKRADPNSPTTAAMRVPEPARRGSEAPKPSAEDEEERHHLTMMHDHLHQTLLMAPTAAESASTALTPPSVWVTSYADFSSKYGLAYKLNTGHTGVHFNDSTKMVWEPITNRCEYLARVKEIVGGNIVAQDSRSSFHMDSFPEAHTKKVTLIKYFKSYLSKQRSTRDGVDVVTCSPFVQTAPVMLTEPHMISDMIYVKRWLITSEAMIFRLSNKSIQVCFFDKAEVILSSEARVVTYTDASGKRRTMSLASVKSQNDDVSVRLRYTKDILSKLIGNREL